MCAPSLRRFAAPSSTRPKRASRPEAARMHGALQVAALPARPSSQTGHRGADRSGPLAPGERRAADLGTRADRPRSAVRALVTIETSAVRVLGRGGGDRSGGGGPGRVCLTQRGELERRINGAPHQLAERAFGLATDDRRGEHVFVKLRVGSDGTARLQGVLAGARRDPARGAANRKVVSLGSAASAASTPIGSGSATASATPRASSSTPTTSPTSTSP